jgi:hypothetical protein
VTEEFLRLKKWSLLPDLGITKIASVALTALGFWTASLTMMALMAASTAKIATT